VPNREDLPRPGSRVRLESRVPAGLYAALRERARLLRKPLAAVVTVALEEYLYRAGRPPA
jgi:hypothetical protein